MSNPLRKESAISRAALARRKHRGGPFATSTVSSRVAPVLTSTSPKNDTAPDDVPSESSSSFLRSKNDTEEDVDGANGHERTNHSTTLPTLQGKDTLSVRTNAESTTSANHRGTETASATQSQSSASSYTGPFHITIGAPKPAAQERPEATAYSPNNNNNNVNSSRGSSSTGGNNHSSSNRPLLERSSEVAGEVAALLATVRKNRATSPLRNGNRSPLRNGNRSPLRSSSGWSTTIGVGGVETNQTTNTQSPATSSNGGYAHKNAFWDETKTSHSNIRDNNWRLQEQAVLSSTTANSKPATTAAVKPFETTSSTSTRGATAVKSFETVTATPNWDPETTVFPKVDAAAPRVPVDSSSSNGTAPITTRPHSSRISLDEEAEDPMPHEEKKMSSSDTATTRIISNDKPNGDATDRSKMTENGLKRNIAHTATSHRTVPKSPAPPLSTLGFNSSRNGSDISGEEITIEFTNMEDEDSAEQLAEEPLLSPKQTPMVEELEPINHHPVLSPACIWDHSIVVLRSHGTLRTLQIAAVDYDVNADDVEVRQHNMEGYGLGEPDELLRISIQESFMSRTNPEAPTVLCYGDKIILRSDSARNRTFGAIRRRHWEIGFTNQSLANPTEQWRVIRADFKNALTVGRSALEKEAALKQKRGPFGPVHVGDSIALRNCHTGGVLSLDGRVPSSTGPSRLRLISDSHDPHRVRHDAHGDPTLIGRLQRHDRLLPLPAEAFHLMSPAVPPSPIWSTNRILQQQDHVFLKGVYYLQAPDRSMVVRSGIALSTDEPSEQEILLIDELLGSFVGLEGEYIKFQGKSSGERCCTFVLVQPPDSHFDNFLRHIAEELLQLSRAYCSVKHYLGIHLPGYIFGSVVHAFCEKLDSMLHEYVSFIAKVEADFRNQDGNKNLFTLCGLQVRMKPALDVMLVLEKATEAVSTTKGGALLNCLRNFMQHKYEGNDTAGMLLQRLLDAAAAPYLNILGGWVECGILKDAHSEFMVRKNAETGTWETRYSIVQEHVLDGIFTSSLTVDKILASGRYWHALQGCSKSISDKIPVPLNYFESTSTFANYVQANYQRASLALVELLLNRYDLLGSLRLMKRFFLLDHGDFFINFLDAAEDELRKDLTTISMGRIQYWMDVFIHSNDRPSEDTLSVGRGDDLEASALTPKGLRCHFASGSLADQLDDLFAASGGINMNEPWTPLRHVYGEKKAEVLTGLDAFMVDFRSIPFPITLILSRKSLECYQLLFRHLFFSKYVERRLVGIWQDHQDMKELQSLRRSMGPTFLLRQRMLHFVQNLIYYMMLEVIEPNWTEMEAEIANKEAMEGKTIDDVVEIHMRFLNRALEACLLTNRELVRSLTKLMKSCLLFSDQMKLFMKATKISADKYSFANEKQRVVRRTFNDRRDTKRFSMDKGELQKNIQDSRAERKERIQRQTKRVEREIQGESYPRMISRFDQVFSQNLKEFMKQLTQSDDLYHSQKVNLCIRLDYNGYVTRAMGLTTSS